MYVRNDEQSTTTGGDGAEMPAAPRKNPLRWQTPRKWRYRVRSGDPMPRD